jgi:serine/threonine protein kinase
MAVVWLAQDKELRRHVAVKVLSEHVVGDASFQKRFQREARHVASLSHPNIARVFDFGVENNWPFIVMEYVKGPSLRQLFGSVSTFPESVTAELAVQTLGALEHAHTNGLVHRDVKPGNILISFDGTVKMVDFGVAKSLYDTEITIQGSFVGTTTYASPEQLLGDSVGPASDLYSLGCVLYQCLEGIPPGRVNELPHAGPHHGPEVAQDVRVFHSDAPESLIGAIECLLQTDPQRRREQSLHLRDAFSQIAGGGLELLGSLVSKSWGAHESDLPVVGSETTTTDTRETRGFTSDRRHSILEGREAPRTSGRWSPTFVVSVVCAMLLVVVLAFVWSHSQSTHSAGVVRRPTVRFSPIPSGGLLQPGQSIFASNRKFRLTMQTDGNLVDYAEQGTRPLWESDTSGNFDAYAVVQADGNFVVYPKGKSAPAPGKPTPALWFSGTYGHPGAFVELNSSGSVIVRGKGDGSILWSSTQLGQ